MMVNQGLGSGRVIKEMRCGDGCGKLKGAWKLKGPFQGVALPRIRSISEIQRVKNVMGRGMSVEM